MSISTPLYNQLLSLLSQYSQYRDLRHLKALSWMVNALILSSKINLSEWESYVISRAKQAQSLERRWQRFVYNNRIRVKSLYLPVVMAAQRIRADRRLRRLEGFAFAVRGTVEKYTWLWIQPFYGIDTV